MKNDKRLKERIVYLVGLVCGQTQSKYFAEYLCMVKGGNPQSLNKATFRVKDHHRPSNDFGYQFTCSAGKASEGSLFWKKDIGPIWAQKYFTPNSCNFCDDTFAETADIVFLDAWLDEYIRDPFGTNLMLVRNIKLINTIQQGINKKEISISQIHIEKVIKTQEGVIYNKHQLLSERLELAKVINPVYVPYKRVPPLSINKLKFTRLWLEKLLTKIAKLLFHQAKPINSLVIFKIITYILRKLIGLTYHLEK